MGLARVCTYFDNINILKLFLDYWSRHKLDPSPYRESLLYLAFFVCVFESTEGPSASQWITTKLDPLNQPLKRI